MHARSTHNTIRTALAAFKGNIFQKHICSRIVLPHHYHNLTTNFRACGVIDAACTIFAFENRSYLDEFEAELKKALALNQGPRGYYLMKKTEGRKSRETVPLMLKTVLNCTLGLEFEYNFPYLTDREWS
jgi:hypothetical protein